MSRRPSRTSPRLRSSRRPARGRAGFRPTPFFWLVGGLVAALVLLAVGGSWWFAARQPVPTPSPSAPAITSTATSVPVIVSTPTLLPTATQTPLPTEPPRLCQTNKDTDVYSLPDQNAVRESLRAGEALTVVGEIFEDNFRWARVIVSGFERYVPAEDVICGGEP